MGVDVTEPATEISGTRVLPLTRALAAVIVPFLVVAWWILYLRPGDTEQLFAWPVRRSMTAMMLSAVYLGGTYFCIRVIWERNWESVALGFLPVAGSASLMGVATILHWDLFTAGHLAFHVWAVLYFTTPFLVLATWWLNRRHAARQAAAGDRPSSAADGMTLTRRAQAVAGAIGVVGIGVALSLFVWPEQLQRVWPWPLSSLTARVMAAIFVLGGAGIGIARDPRWRSARLLVQVTWVMLDLILLAVVLAWDDFDHGNVLTWEFVACLILVLAGSAVPYRRLERDAAGPPSRRGRAGADG